LFTREFASSLKIYGNEFCIRVINSKQQQQKSAMPSITINRDLLNRYESSIEYLRADAPESVDTSKPSAESVPVFGGKYDAMLGCDRWRVNVDGQYGHVSLVDVMPRMVPAGKTADFAIVQAARVSYGKGTKSVSEDRGLVRYLMRHLHTSPVEHCEIKLHCKMPMFVARQWIRHRTANVNEYSARYSEMKDEFYVPGTVSDVRMQSTTNRQGSETNKYVEHDVAANFITDARDLSFTAFNRYMEALEGGVSREQARMVLPVNIMTEWYWKIDLHNLFHFLALRMDAHAQHEMQQYALAVYAIVKQLFPVACEAFEDYRIGSVTLTRLEVEALRESIKQKQVGFGGISNARERAEWEHKAVQILRLDENQQ
jgi:thymidylate synthase (FAD)